MSDLPLQIRRQESETWLEFGRIHREMTRRVGALLEGEGLDDVTPAQANVLMRLFHEKRPMHAREIATSLSVSEVTMGRFVHALEAAGWVSRTPDPRDARAHLVRPTARAYRALPRFIRVSNAVLDAAFAGMEPEAIGALADAVARIARNLEAPPE
ncbi:MAG: MarR family winged helix-turn-helix transcriptional regulator [Myxococcota bacterium]